MAEGQGVSSFPLPPMQYVNLYTDENTKRGRTPKPPPPIKDNYSMFGVTFHADDAIIRPLESQGLRRLYPQSYDPKRELKKLNHSILVNFLDLLDILIKAPDSPKRGEKIDDLTLLFIHVHHLINEFRPHQARETLRVMMQTQRRQRLETAERFQKHLEKVQEIIEAAIGALPDDSDLDTKLTIKTETTETSVKSNGDIKEPLHKRIKTEGKDDIEGKEEEESEEGDMNTLDEMMCGIVDAL